MYTEIMVTNTMVAITRNQQLFQYCWQAGLVTCLVLIGFSTHKEQGKFVVRGTVGRVALRILQAGLVVYVVIGVAFVLSLVLGGGYSF